MKFQLQKKNMQICKKEKFSKYLKYSNSYKGNSSNNRKKEDISNLMINWVMVEEVKKTNQRKRPLESELAIKN